MSIRNLTVTPSHWHPCAQTSRDPSDARDMAPHSPVYGHCRECTLGLTQSNKRFFSPSKALAVPEHRGFFFDPCKRVLGFGSSGGTQAAQCRRVQGLSPTVPVSPVSLHNGTPRPWPVRGIPSQPCCTNYNSYFSKVTPFSSAKGGWHCWGRQLWRGHNRELKSGERRGDLRMH